LNQIISHQSAFADFDFWIVFLIFLASAVAFVILCFFLGALYFQFSANNFFAEEVKH
jgi:hypothetical protein